MQSQEVYAQEIAKKHGMLLSKDDPLWMLHTYLETFLHDLRSQQEEVLKVFVATLEGEHTKWNVENKARAERILSAALEAAYKASGQQIQAETSKMLEAMSVAMQPQLEKLENQSRVGYYLAVAHIIGAGLLAVAGLFFFLTR